MAIALDALYNLPTHGDKSEQEIQHELNLSATLFPPALIRQAESEYIDWLSTIHDCGCDCCDACSCLDLPADH